MDPVRHAAGEGDVRPVVSEGAKFSPSFDRSADQESREKRSRLSSRPFQQRKSGRDD